MRRTNARGAAAMALMAVCSLALTGCPSSSSGDGSGVVDAEVVADGVISGRVVVIDRSGTRLGDKSGVVVSVEEQAISAMSTSDGGWELTGVAGGTLAIVWEKPGFGMSKQVGIKFPGGRLTGLKGWVVERPRHTVDHLADSTAGTELFFVGTVHADPSLPSGAIRFFVGTNPQVSADPRAYVATMKGICFGEDAASPPEGLDRSTVSYQPSFCIPLDPDIRHQLGPGATLYVIAYADAFFSLSYVDQGTGREVFTTLNPQPSPVIRTVIP